ncbi:MAG TPA: class I SAM-dependent methyltransferase [Candidatus Paceibacterota bacterium]
MKESEIDQLVDWVNCDLCGGKNYRIIYPGAFTRADFVKDPSSSFRYASSEHARGNIVECADCHLVYMNPRDRDIPTIYENVGEDEYYLSAQEDRIATFERDYQKLESVIGSAKGRKMIDVGCSYGLFLGVCQRHGWEVYGCEPSKVQWAKAREYYAHVYNKELRNCGFSDNLFDLVTMHEVIEHPSSPKALIRDARAVIKPGGYLVLCTPDRSSWQAKIFGKRWIAYARMHLYYFTPHTLRRMLEEEGFRVVKIEKHKRIIRFGVAIEWMRKNPFLYRVFLAIFGNFLTRNIKITSAMSGNMMVYAQKIDQV